MMTGMPMNIKRIVMMPFIQIVSQIHYQKVAPKSPVRSQSGDAKNFGTVFDPKVCVAHAVASECLLAPFDLIPYL